MVASASARRDVNRRAKLRLIHQHALELAERSGLDGFTMEDLADAAGVSRRTLFNYYPGKVDAVLGPFPEPDPGLVARFRAGGPTGALVRDTALLAEALLAVEEIPADRDQLALARRVLDDEPRLLAASRQRFAEYASSFVEAAREREAENHDPVRAELAVRFVVAIFEVALDLYLHTDAHSSLAEAFAHARATAETLGS